MGKTIVEKIISGHVGEEVKAGDYCVVPVDMLMCHDATGPLAIKAFREFEREECGTHKVAFVLDHATPSPNERISGLHDMLRSFAKEQGIRFFDVGEGICHQLMLEKGMVLPGDIALGTDSYLHLRCRRGIFLRHRINRRKRRAPYGQIMVKVPRP